MTLSSMRIRVGNRVFALCYAHPPELPLVLFEVLIQFTAPLNDMAEPHAAGVTWACRDKTSTDRFMKMLDAPVGGDVGIATTKKS